MFILLTCSGDKRKWMFLHFLLVKKKYIYVLSMIFFCYAQTYLVQQEYKRIVQMLSMKCILWQIGWVLFYTKKSGLAFEHFIHYTNMQKESYLDYSLNKHSAVIIHYTLHICYYNSVQYSTSMNALGTINIILILNLYWL